MGSEMCIRDRIHGDGEQSRDFTFVANAVEANIRSMFTQVPEASGKVYNIAFGDRTTVNQLFQGLKSLTDSKIDPEYVDSRPGDIRDSLADISLAQKYLGYDPQSSINQGLAVTFEWFKKRFG